MVDGPRDRDLIDALEKLPLEAFDGRVWRITRDGRDPTLFFAGGNRWDDGTFDVLYTSLSREGALAEMRFHVSKGQPVVPSKVKYRLHELEIHITGVVNLTDETILQKVGIDASNFGKLPYLDRHGEYEKCQEVGETIHFLGSSDDGYPSAILVPNARHSSHNLVLLADYVSPDAVTHIKDHGIVEWTRD